MVHKRSPPRGQHSPAATVWKDFAWQTLIDRLRKKLGVREQQVEATVALLDGGATVPFGGAIPQGNHRRGSTMRNCAPWKSG